MYIYDYYYPPQTIVALGVLAVPGKICARELASVASVASTRGLHRQILTSRINLFDKKQYVFDQQSHIFEASN